MARPKWTSRLIFWLSWGEQSRLAVSQVGADEPVVQDRGVQDPPLTGLGRGVGAVVAVGEA